MAVHSVSLHWVAQIRHSFAEQERNRAIASESPSGGSGELNDRTPGQGKEAAAESILRPQPIDIDPTSLGLSSSEVEGLVEQLGPAGGQAVLLLVYKLSSIESELSAMRALIGHSGPKSFPSPATDSHAELTTDKKTDPDDEAVGPPGILDQVFSSNLALYNSMK